MGATGRHRLARPRKAPRPVDVAWRRHSLAAVGGVVVVALLGYSSHPVRVVDLEPGPSETSDPAGGAVVDMAVTASAPLTFLRPLVASPSEPGGGAAGVAGGGGIPGPALAAYQRAASVMAEAAPACELSWTLLAGIGRVESDHGRYGAAVLGSDGVSRPLIVGVALDGAGRVAEIRDTDAGQLDGDDVWDRAVGPMQFLPTTWAFAGVDGDGDGVRSPHDLDDAALAAGVYLCAGGGELSRPEGIRAAVYRYNHSAAYVALVMSYERRYRTGRYAVGAGLVVPSAIVAAAARSPLPAAGQVAPVARTDRVEAADPPSVDAKPGAPAPAPPPAPVLPPDPADEDGPGTSPLPTPLPTLTPAPDPAPDPAPSPEPDRAPSPAPGLDPEPATAQAPDPGASPTDTEPDTDRITVTGLWTVCDDGFCLDGIPLVLGDPEQLGDSAAEDYDGDRVVETYEAELVGLVDTTVVVVVDLQEGSWVVLSLNDLSYPVTQPAD